MYIHIHIHIHTHTEEFMDLPPDNTLFYLNTSDEIITWKAISPPPQSDMWPVARAWHGMAHMTNTSKFFMFGGRTGEDYGTCT
jgi:hypothetical protein